jgi:hypothetical protein
MIDQINNLENKVNNLYKNKKLKPSILNEFNIIENNIKNEFFKDKNNPIFNTYFKNLDLFKERTILKLEKIDLENQLINKSKTSVKKKSKLESSGISIKTSDSSQQTITSSSSKSSSYTKYLIYLLIIIIVIIIIYFLVKNFL